MAQPLTTMVSIAGIWPTPPANAMQRSCCTQDLEPLIRLAGKRCMDGKGTVRKAALALLEALLILQTRMHGKLPDSAARHLAAFSAATSDSLVSLQHLSAC